MDARRVVAVLVTVAGLCVLVLGLSGFDPAPGFLPNAGGIGAAVGAAIHGVSHHRKQGWLGALGWGVLRGGSVIAFIVILHVVAAWIRPAITAHATAVELGWPMALAGAAAMVCGALLWERSGRVRRVMAMLFGSIGLIWAGMLSFLVSGLPPAVGAIAIALGIVGLMYGAFTARDERRRIEAERPASNV